MATTLRTRLAITVVVVASLFVCLPAGAVITSVTPAPDWSGLTPQQQQTLAPLAADWNTLKLANRQKWLGVVNRYPKMKPEEQERIQKQMLAWAKLTPEQRAAARQKYITLKSSPPEKKEIVKQKWASYLELPDDEKLRLKEEASHKPTATPKSATGKAAPMPRPLTHPLASASGSTPTPVAPLLTRPILLQAGK